MNDGQDGSIASPERLRVPLLVYDGDCGFCRLWIERWRSLTGDRVEYAPYQEVAGRFPQIAIEDFKNSVQMVMPDGAVLAAAQAVFRTLACIPGMRWMLWMYETVPGVPTVSQTAYRFVAKRRRFFSKLTRLLWGKSLLPPSYTFTKHVFLRLLGIAYLIAFLSLSRQVLGLVGSHGILPAGLFMRAVKENLGPERYWLFPSLTWLNSSDGFLRVLTMGGALLSVLLIIGIAIAPVLILLWISYVSLVVAGQDFMMFQWDGLLLEAGFLAIFFAPFQILPRHERGREPSHTVLWLLRLLLFRLMFSSGLAKLLSGDPTWRRLTALNYHYETQPLPTPLGWFFYQFPGGFQKISVAVMFCVELLVPFLIFAPRRLRFFAASATVFLQIVIALTGNYAFFNLLTIALCIPLLDDELLVRIVPRWFRGKIPESRGRVRRGLLRQALTACFAAAIIFGGVAEIPGVRTGRRLPRPAALVLNRMRSLRIVSGYGLFAVMTTSRLEIVIEGSRDGETWLAYEFKYKPGDVKRAPPWVAPHQPRLDWQMWFAALGNYQENPWFGNLVLRLLQGSPDVLGLLRTNPFPEAPPRYVRALIYDYHFTDFATRSATGTWWRRRLIGLYFPAVSLPDNTPE